MITVHLIRHAHAGDRTTWTGDDELRPLTPKGWKQAEAIAARLGPLAVGRLLSSPAARCTETLGPLAGIDDLLIESAPALAEGADPRATFELVVTQERRAALSSHGDVIPAIIEMLARTGVPLVDGRELRDGDVLRCAKASTWDLELEAGRVVRGTYVPPPGKA